jgi:hypothetical protein
MAAEPILQGVFPDEARALADRSDRHKSTLAPEAKAAARVAELEATPPRRGLERLPSGAYLDGIPGSKPIPEDVSEDLPWR